MYFIWMELASKMIFLSWFTGLVWVSFSLSWADCYESRPRLLSSESALFESVLATFCTSWYSNLNFICFLGLFFVYGGKKNCSLLFVSCYYYCYKAGEMPQSLQKDEFELFDRLRGSIVELTCFPLL